MILSMHEIDQGKNFDKWATCGYQIQVQFSAPVEVDGTDPPLLGGYCEVGQIFIRKGNLDHNNCLLDITGRHIHTPRLEVLSNLPCDQLTVIWKGS